MGVRTVYLCDVCGRETTLDINDGLRGPGRCECGQDLAAQEMAKLVPVVLALRKRAKGAS